MVSIKKAYNTKYTGNMQKIILRYKIIEYNAKINESTFMQMQETINESKNWNPI